VSVKGGLRSRHISMMLRDVGICISRHPLAFVYTGAHSRLQETAYKRRFSWICSHSKYQRGAPR